MLQFPPTREAVPGSILFIIPAHLASGTAWFRPNGVLQRLGRTSQRVQLPGLPQVFLSLGPSLHSLQVGWGAPWPAPRPLRTVADSSPMCLADSLTNPFPWIIPIRGPAENSTREGEPGESAPEALSLRGPPLSWAPSSACPGGSGGVRGGPGFGAVRSTGTRSRGGWACHRVPDQPRTVRAPEAPTPRVRELPAQWVRTRTVLNSSLPSLIVCSID